MGPGRVELLQAIDRWHSISAAARQIGMSYRHAWLLVQSINESAGKLLVESAIGGKQGGGARLTEFGKQAVQVFRELQTEVQNAATHILPRVLQMGDRQAHLHVSAAISLEEVLGQLLAEYALRQPTVRVRAVFGASNELADHILAGSPCDLFLSADAAQVARLARAGLAAAARQPCLARNGLAVIVPEDSKARLRRPRDLLHPELKRIAVADAESPLGRYTLGYLSQLGLSGPLHDRVVNADNARAVLSVLHAGRADAAIVYSSDAALANGVRIAFRPRTAIDIAYRAAVLTTARSPDHARSFLKFLTSPAAARKFRACGFLPLAPH